LLEIGIAQHLTYPIHRILNMIRYYRIVRLYGYFYHISTHKCGKSYTNKYASGYSICLAGLFSLLPLAKKASARNWMLPLFAIQFHA